MLLIPTQDIKVSSDRQRKEFDKRSVEELAESISSKGLMHPIVLRADGQTLVAGERRLRAVQLLWEREQNFSCNGEPVPENCIPALQLGTLDEYSIEEAELEENIKREDLTWQERAAAEARLHKLFSMKAADKGISQTVRATADELFEGKATKADETRISTSVYLAEHLDDPDVAKAKSIRDAEKIVRRKLEQEILNALATHYSTDEKQSSRHDLYHGDCMDVFPTLASGSIDVVCSDPIYGISADGFGEQSSGHTYDDSPKTWERIMPKIAEQLFRVTKPLAHCYLFCDPTRFGDLAEYMLAAGWDVWKTPLIWYKGNKGTLPRPDHGPRRTYETILYAIKGGKTVLQTGKHDVLPIPQESVTEHGAKKPTAVYHDLIARSVAPGDVVLDFMGGTGSIIPAAHSLRCKAVYIELDQDSYNRAVVRTKELPNV